MYYHRRRLTREAIQIDRTQQLIEANAVLWVFGEVLIDHAQCRLENCIEDGRHLGRQQRLLADKSVEEVT
jgi:hypothetical protein